MPDVVLYTRVGCHLCDDAGAVLARHGLEVRAIDVDSDPQLQARYNECVPVVVIDGRERFRGRVDELLLRRLLAQRRDT
jgi:glutaredoxin